MAAPALMAPDLATAADVARVGVAPVGPGSTRLAFAALGALGAGVVHLGLASAHATSPAWALALAAVGLAETGWSLLALRAGRPVFTRPAAVSLLALAGAWPVLVVQGVAPHDGGLSAADVAVVLLGVLAAAGAALASREGRTQGRADAARPGGWRGLAGWAAAALVVAALITPGLAATPAGAAAVPHGSGGHGDPAGGAPGGGTGTGTGTGTGQAVTGPPGHGH